VFVFRVPAGSNEDSVFVCGTQQANPAINAPKHVSQVLKKEADAVKIVQCPSDFKTVEQFYQDFSEIKDEQVVNIVSNR
jgi:predicted phosphoribosyltransferase